MTGSLADHSPRSSAGTRSRPARISRPTASPRRSHTPISVSRATQTGGLGAEQGVGGNSWASLLLGIPSAAGYRNIHEVASGGWINGIFIQDQFKATSRLTINLGFRNDMVLTPIYGTGKGGNYYTGEANPITGQYILNALPPDCSATQGAPCIPTGIYTASEHACSGRASRARNRQPVSSGGQELAVQLGSTVGLGLPSQRTRQ